MAKVGVIGGSGLYALEGMEKIGEESLLTPFGQPSGNFIVGRLEDVEVVFLPRHGRGHTLSPSEINYRANIFAMKRLGVEAIVSVSACGSLKEEIRPLDFVVPDQFVDLTRGRETSFFGGGAVVHVSMADPFAEEIRGVLVEAAGRAGVTCHPKGTYVNMEGPQFSTRAESMLYRRWGMDIIGMTNATEAKLAREAEISYATLAAVTDYDCWRTEEAAVTVEMVAENLRRNVAAAKKILEIAVPIVGRIERFSAAGALKNAVLTAPEMIPEDKRKELDLF